MRRGLATSRQQAGQLIADGRVRVAGVAATKPATQVAPEVSVAVTGSEDDPGFVSRGAHKLAAALELFGAADPPLLVRDRHCLDAGASTGGFTDVLLRAGAADVHAVDVGYGQLAWRLRTDPRVHVLERQNVRLLEPAQLGGPADLTVADLSFISLTVVLPALSRCTAAAGDIVVLVKPQFEVGREGLGKNGVVREPALRAFAVRTVAQAASDLGWSVHGLRTSPLPGPAGNIEYLLWLRRDPGVLPEDAIAAVVAAGPGGPGLLRAGWAG